MNLITGMWAGLLLSAWLMPPTRAGQLLSLSMSAFVLGTLAIGFELAGLLDPTTH